MTNLRQHMEDDQFNTVTETLIRFSFSFFLGPSSSDGQKLHLLLSTMIV